MIVSCYLSFRLLSLSGYNHDRWGDGGYGPEETGPRELSTWCRPITRTQ